MKRKNKIKKLDYYRNNSVAKSLGNKTSRQDSFYNKSNNFGGTNDALLNTIFVRDPWMNQEQLDALYDANWAAKRAVDAPVRDMFSKWITFLADNQDENSIKKNDELEGILKQYSVKEKLADCKRQSRIHWGAAIYFDYGDDPESPLFEVKRPPIRTEIVNSWYCIPTTYYRPEIYGSSFPKLGEPEHYTVVIQHPGFQESFLVHETRLLTMKGLPPSDARIAIERRGWGFSVLESMSTALKGYGIGMQSSADILQEYYWKVLKIKDLGDLIADNEDDVVIKRVAFAANAMNGQNIGVFGEEEELRRESANVGGIPDVLDRQANQLCAAAHPGIPWSVFFSAEGGSLGGTSAESDVKNYYKRINGIQENEIRPDIDQFIYMLGIDPTEFTYVFNNLDEPTRKEELEFREIQMRTDVGYISAQVLLPEEVTESRYSSDEVNLDQVLINKDLRAEIEREQMEVDEPIEDDEDQPDNEDPGSSEDL